MPKSNPTSSRDKILDELARVGREHSDATVLFHATVASLLDLHPTDYKMLGILVRSGPLSAGEIARWSGLATASVTNLIDRLELKGFVRRVADPTDRRRVMVEAVGERLTSARSLLASTRRSLAQLYDRYSDRDLSVIADFLQHNAERLRAETGKLSTTAMSISPLVVRRSRERNRQHGDSDVQTSEPQERDSV
jgi:DNA-binding MarR family transcriptional regulator